MTEEELRQHILSATDRRGKGEQPPFADTAFPLHPYKPIDYELVRAEMYERILGPCDGVFHPPMGAPHIDVYRYPPVSDRPFWSYVTNGMSDFRQILPDDSWFRSEIMCASGAVRIQLPITSGKSEISGSNLRRLSISFSQERIWFEVGMLWDASNFG